ncbi:MAG: DUF2007 domain-containing protein [Acidobacteriota bacterium]|nr:DUF2007 domain-containing protein [Acidobacteriota bacterium]MDH3786346.1 DUF2007 domain-containing protein [Acidobacteriota bacterium]
MTCIHSAPNGFEVHNLKNVLEASGIRCEVRGEFRKSGAGELPLNECWVELWLLDDARMDEAKKLLVDLQRTDRADWTCKGCGESVEGQFSRCWNCGHTADDES